MPYIRCNSLRIIYMSNHSRLSDNLSPYVLRYVLFVSDTDARAYMSSATTRSKTMYLVAGKLHSVNDRVTVVSSVDRAWHMYNIAHRIDKPACIGPYGRKLWLIHGEPRRDGKRPTYMWPDGSMYWHVRENGRPTEIYVTGIVKWRERARGLPNVLHGNRA